MDNHGKGHVCTPHDGNPIIIYFIQLMIKMTRSNSNLPLFVLLIIILIVMRIISVTIIMILVMDDIDKVTEESSAKGPGGNFLCA